MGSGVFVHGYKVEVTPKSDFAYSGLTFGDSQLKESSMIVGRMKQTEPLTIYEFETCPFCRKVREAVSTLSLTVTFLPCPKNGLYFRQDIKSKYGPRATFPFLRDPNTGVELFESDAIIEYLFKTYADSPVPPLLSPSNPLVPISAGIGLIWRGGGTRKAAEPPPLAPVRVWLYEGSPFCKLVREALCELEIPHTQISCPRGSSNRQAMFSDKGRFQVPYLEDPNTDVKLFESDTIVQYLRKQYGVEEQIKVKYL